MEDFILFALLGGIGIAVITCSIGSFIVWRKMSYFGDALSHAAFLGIAIALMIEISPIFGSIIISVVFALLFSFLKKKYSNDTILGILAQGGFALAIIIFSFMNNIRVDLTSYLFGDILSINIQDIISIYLFLLIQIIWLKKIWKSLLMLSIDKNFAFTQQIDPKKIELSFTVLMSIIIVISIKLVGIFLVSSLMIIPAATARAFSKSPLSMIFISIIIGVISVILGVFSSIYINTPTGPTIILFTLILFSFSVAINKQN